MVAKRSRKNLRGGIGTIVCEFLVGQRLRSGNELVGVRIVRPMFADSVLYLGTLPREPGLNGLLAARSD